MRKRVLAFGVLVGLAVRLAALDRLSPEALPALLRTVGPVTVIDQGVVVDRLSVSRDGQWAVYAYFEQDIQSNRIRLVSTSTGDRHEVSTPRGFKHTPVVYGDTIWFTLDAPATSSFRDGIYSGSWERSGPWALWEAGSFRDLSLSDDGRFLAASTGDFDRATVRSTVKVWALTASGGRAGEPYDVGTGVQGQVRQIAWGPGALTLFIEVADGQDVSRLYLADNRPGAPARLVGVGYRKPVVGRRGGLATLFFVQGDWQASRLVARTLPSGPDVVVASVARIQGEGLTANGLAWDPAGRLLLGVQASATVAAVVAFSPP